MILRSSQLRPIPSFLLPYTQSKSQVRTFALPPPKGGLVPYNPVDSKPLKYRLVPKPTPFVPDAETFLKLIGRNMSQYAAKFPSWRSLFTMTSEELEELGIVNARARRYLQTWREKYRSGAHGIGGDLRFVKDGVAELRVHNVVNSPTKPEGATLQNIVVNVPPGAEVEDLPPNQRRPVRGLRVHASHTIAGPYIQQVRGRKKAVLVVQEGMWEIPLGRKIDGGERRQAEVRAKARGEERRALTGAAR
ncbi:hypothetical protein D0Z07_8975 [Hyphodiscus hymeniophilus]|uniref:Small ribosomal subunit protein mS41 n=1 Tax=Hyphodiscus hymeniophilus TaxID=353542 RepID=A0A9P6SPI7_9HELO|nr:hypothetical protein D0Z07_8975 [Hyphodiscus hymeniophilus]